MRKTYTMRQALEAGSAEPSPSSLVVSASPARWWTKQVAGAVRVDVAVFADDGVVAAFIAAKAAGRGVEGD